MAIPVPASLDALDAPTMTAALVEGGALAPRGRVTTVTQQPFAAGQGFLGDLARLALTYDPTGPAGPSTVVAKAPTTDPGGREVGRLLSVWPRESRFFADLAGSIAARVPRCYYNGADPERERWLLLLEDCGDTEAHQQTGANAAQAHAAVEELVRLHGPWLPSRTAEANDTAPARPTRWMPGFDQGPLQSLEWAVVGAVEPFLARFGDHLPSPTPDWLRRFAPTLAAWSARRAQHPLTLVHADYRLDNLIVRGTSVVVVDWQTALVAPGAMDLSSFLATSLTTEDRRATEHELFAAYASGLGADASEVRRDVGEHLLWWMALYANNLSRLHPDDEHRTAALVLMATRIFTAALDHDAGALVDRA